MEKLLLQATIRTPEESAKDVIASGYVPAEYYGHGVKNISLKVEYEALRKVYRRAGGNTIVELEVDGKEKKNVLIHQVQTNPITDRLTHIDFMNVKMTEKITTEIPLRFEGMSLAVKDQGGTLVTHMDTLSVECLPGDLVHDIEVNIEPLVDFNVYIRVKDLVVPQGITVLDDAEAVVVNAVPPRKEEEVVAPVAEGEAGAEGGEAAKEGEAGAQTEEKSA